ncbi:MAG: hypothetical protein ABH863_02805, partial [Candidatus Micrarchaeota archaeon]
MKNLHAFFAFALFALIALPMFASAVTYEANSENAESSSASSGGASAAIAVAEKVIAAPISMFPIHFQKGWNLFSSPISNYGGSAMISRTDCLSKAIYYYSPPFGDQKEGGYSIVGYMQDGTSISPGNGYWFKAQEDCSAVFMGAGSAVIDGKVLYRGWNQIGSTADKLQFSEMLGGCSIISGPYEFNTAAYQWEKASINYPGKGYFVKVASQCNLETSNPPNPPETTPTATTYPKEGFDIGIRDIVIDPANPIAGESVTVTVSLYNYGDVGGYFTSMSLMFTGGGEGINIGGGTGGSLGGNVYLGPGEFYYFKATNNFPTGGWWTGTVTVKAKEDLNQNNNIYSEKFYVKPHGATPTPTVYPTATSVPDCAYSGDGTYNMRIGCTLKSSDGNMVKLTNVYSNPGNPIPLLAELVVTDSSGSTK